MLVAFMAAVVACNGQLWHIDELDAPRSALYEPTGHGLSMPEAQKYPARQAGHCSGVERSRAVEKVPGGHATGKGVP